MDIDSYLNRIRYSGSRLPDAETLRSLHRAHMLTVPFENLDIHLRRPIVVDEIRFFEKIVLHHRGGFCYELNGLFAALLREMNFDVTLLSARVYSGADPGPEFDHMVLLVDTGDRWLADVGFGESFIEPLSLDDPEEQVQRGVGYRIVHEGITWRVYQRQSGAPWEPLYAFTMKPRRLEEFSAMCHWQQTAPESHFTQKRICSIAAANGRVTLTDMKLILTKEGVREERLVANDEEYDALLRKYFGFNLAKRDRT